VTEFLGFFEIQDECSARSRNGRGCPEPAMAMAVGMVKGQLDRGGVWVCQGHIDGLVGRGLEPQAVGRVCVRREDGKTPCGRAATHVMAVGADSADMFVPLCPRHLAERKSRRNNCPCARRRARGLCARPHKPLVFP
jgi:hypothetical protein